MNDDLAQLLRNLQSLRAVGVIDEAAYQRGLANLRAQYSHGAVDVLLGTPAPATQTIGDHAQVGVAVAGDVHGNIYLNGQRTRSAAQLLAGYLQRLSQRCGTLPLQGVREQRAADDVLRISLDQVYTQLATTNNVLREHAITATGDSFSAQHIITTYGSNDLFPQQRRTKIVLRGGTYEPGYNPHCPRCGNISSWHLYCSECGLMFADSEYSINSLDMSKFDEERVFVRGIDFYGPQLVTETIAATQRLVLLGEPGSGKSTALRYLALTLARAGLDTQIDLASQLEGWDRFGTAGRLLPIFLPLLPLAKLLAEHPNQHGSADDLWNYLAAHLEPKGAHLGLAAVVRDELEAGRVLLLLDGLDEVAGNESRRKVVQAVRAFADELPQCRMVVTCRIRAYEGEQNRAWQLAGWPTATLADWTMGQMTHFVSAWYGAAAASSGMLAAKRDDRIAALQRAIANRADLQRLGVRPLLLTIMALVHLNDGRLPEDRVSLYSRCIDILLSQWEERGKDSTEYGALMTYIGLPDLDVKALRPLLTRAAAAAHEAGSADTVGMLGRDTLRILVADGLKLLGHPDAHTGALQFLVYTDLRAGLLQANSVGDAYAFPHQTFQEYLAGLDLVSGVDFVDRIMKRRSDDRWRVPIFLGIGHAVSEEILAAPFQLLNRLLKARGRTEDQRQRDLIFAAELASDVGWDRLERGGAEFVDLRTELAQALARVVEGTALPATDRVRAGVYLGALGDLRPGVCTLPPLMVEIPSGTFLIGATPETAQYTREHNDQPLTLSSFEIARYPVTNAQFALFIADNGYNSNQPWWDAAGRTWLKDAGRVVPDNWDDERFGQVRPNHPVVGVTWHEAMAFCRWLTRHPVCNPNRRYVYQLPSEAEWEYVVRGDSRRPYPWGIDEPDAERANYHQIYEGTTAVGCFATDVPPDRERIDDLVGNVWEWTRSAFEEYPYNVDDGREDVSTPENKRFTLRGGSWNNPPLNLRASSRSSLTPVSYYDLDVGLRLARHLAAEPLRR